MVIGPLFTSGKLPPAICTIITVGVQNNVVWDDINHDYAQFFLISPPKQWYIPVYNIRYT